MLPGELTIQTAIFFNDQTILVFGLKNTIINYPYDGLTTGVKGSKCSYLTPECYTPPLRFICTPVYLY
jgi:hypothetical protein